MSVASTGSYNLDTNRAGAGVDGFWPFDRIDVGKSGQSTMPRELWRRGRRGDARRAQQPTEVDVSGRSKAASGLLHVSPTVPTGLPRSEGGGSPLSLFGRRLSVAEESERKSHVGLSVFRFRPCRSSVFVARCFRTSLQLLWGVSVGTLDVRSTSSPANTSQCRYLGTTLRAAMAPSTFSFS